ncbi:hypothetical protein BJX68DRAFT_226232, partial [Aspergillus pseudodeflectus]
MAEFVSDSTMGVSHTENLRPPQGSEQRGGQPAQGRSPPRRHFCERHGWNLCRRQRPRPGGGQPAQGSSSPRRHFCEKHAAECKCTTLN